MRLASVQARLVQCYYLLAQSRINQCWSLFGTTAHLALAIGLNRSRCGDRPGQVDYIELECQRRTFWSAYVLDKFMSAALGRPMTLRDPDIDQVRISDLVQLQNYLTLRRNSQRLSMTMTSFRTPLNLPHQPPSPPCEHQ